MKKARLVRCSGPAAWNMAVDEALMTLAPAPGDFILRFYEWEGPAITLGRFQHAESSIDLEYCRNAGIPVVRRPTGGRSVYHDRDLTYALILPDMAVGGRSVMASYRLISAAFSAGLAKLGIGLRQGVLPAPGQKSRADCFAHLSMADLADGQQKMIGSAQLRRNGWLLQQGSIRVWAMKVPSAVFRGSDSLVSMDLRGYSVSQRQVEACLAGELACLLGCCWEQADLESAELEMAKRLMIEKYATDEWNRGEQAGKS